MSNAMCLGTAAFAFVSLAGAPAAGDRAIKADYPVASITGRVHVIYAPVAMPNKENQGYRNNTGIVVTSAGVVVIDPGGSVYAGQMVVEKIRTLTDRPVVAVFNTHAHGSHWLGNDGVKRAYPKAVIYAHPRMKALTDAGEGEQWIKRLNELTEGAIEGTIVVGPDKVVAHGEVVPIGDRRFRLYHLGSAHSDSDIAIEVVEEKVMFVGDIVRVKALGREEGSFQGKIAAIGTALSSAAQTFVPGHGPAGGREQLADYRRYLEKFYVAVQQFYKEGLMDFEMKPKVIEALSPYRGWIGFDTWIGPHVSQAYLEVEAAAF